MPLSRVGTFGTLLEYGIERRLTPHSNLGATMVVGIPFGVTLKIKLTRASQTYTFPIHLADEVRTKFKQKIKLAKLNI